MDYRTSLHGVEPAHLDGFFVGWPAPPDPKAHWALLAGSSHVVLAVDGDQVVGFVTAISDGVLTAYIPLLEVRPERRGEGIGSELARRLLIMLNRFYMVDVVCDPELIPFYERLGFAPLAGMARRNRHALG